MNETRWQRYDVLLRAVINDVEVPLSQVAISWELNAIPMAQLMLPPGRAVDNLSASTIHKLVKSLTEQQTVKVYATFVSGPDSHSGDVPDLEMPPGEFLIFDGITAGTGYSRGERNANFVVYAQHWLVRLNNSSAFSESSHPYNPAQYSFGAIQPDLGGGAAQGNYSTLTMAAPFVTPANVVEDLWGKALHPLFLKWTEQNALWIQEVGLQGEGENTGAKEALERMSAEVNCYQPLAVDLDVDQDLAESMIYHSSLMLADPSQYANHTLWDVIVGKFSPEYLFSVVPTISEALVVPFIPGLREAYKEVQADTQSSIELNAQINRSLRAVGVTAMIGLRGGSDLFPADTPNTQTLGVGGWYEGRPKGLVTILQGPQWMSHLISYSGFADRSAGGDLKPIGTGVAPGVGVVVEARDTLKGAAEKMKSFLDLYARTLFAIESIKDRQGVFSGPVRFDIAPGSTIKIFGISDTFIAEDGLALPFFASVLRVQFFADAEAKRAGTAFHLAHIRSEEENKADATSIDRHPLYKNKWTGCSLLTPAQDTPAVEDEEEEVA